MSVESNDMLFNLSYELDNIGYKMYATKYKEYYRVYTGPFTNYYTANKALKRVQKNISKNASVVELDMRNNNYILSQETDISKVLYKTKKQHLKQSLVKEKRDFFAGVSFGVTKFDIDEKTVSGAITLAQELDDSGMAYSIEYGYYFNNNFFVALEYKYAGLDDLSFSNFYSTFNYQFDKFVYIYPYVSALVGYSIASWEINPVNSVASDAQSSELSYGFGLGVKVYSADRFSVNLFYRYTDLGHTTNLNTTDGEKNIIHNNEQSFNLGLRYSF